MQTFNHKSIEVQSAGRRSFLITAGGFSIGIALTGCASTDKSASREIKAASKYFNPNAWMSIGNNGIVTLMSPASEMGQGTMTAMPLLIAEEMDLDWARCKVVQAPFRAKDFGNPMFGGGMTTGASRTTQGYYEVMRLAGLQARAIVMAAAAKQLNVPISELATEPHTVIHKASGKRLDYGDIADFAMLPSELPKVDKTMLKPMSEFRLIGKDQQRIDGFDKVTGRTKYGIDTALPGMLYGAVLRAPVQGERPLSIDDSAARAIAGVKQIVTLPYGVGVIASNTWVAFKARDALKVQWSNDSKTRAYDSDVVRREFSARAANQADAGVALHSHGNTAAAMTAAGSKVVGGIYTTEALYHACLEPMNATALVKADGMIEVWTPSQSATLVGVYLGIGAGVKPEQLTVNITQIGGGYGRRVEADYCVDAVLLARAMPGTPVKMTWTRADDVMRDKVRPAIGQQMQVAIDKDGIASGMLQRIVGEGIYARVAPPAFAAAGGKDLPTCEGFETVYGFPNHLAQYMREQRAVDAGFWRGVGGGYTKFAMESVMDEAAAAANQNPLGFRLRLLDKTPRAKAVLHSVAEMANWSAGQTKDGAAGKRALGMAYSDMWNSHIALIAEVSVIGNTIRVHEVWASVDCGHAIQPGNVARQIEGSIILGISAALKEKLDIKGGVFQQDNFSNYPVLRMNETPKINVKLLITDNRPGGIGEVGLPPVAPAISNAIAALTGKRLRSLPLMMA
jgi:isoquinoline 1-oxidoreductase subunit beta